MPADAKCISPERVTTPCILLKGTGSQNKRIETSTAPSLIVVVLIHKLTSVKYKTRVNIVSYTVKRPVYFNDVCRHGTRRSLLLPLIINLSVIQHIFIPDYQINPQVSLEELS